MAVGFRWRPGANYLLTELLPKQPRKQTPEAHDLHRMQEDHLRELSAKGQISGLCSAVPTSDQQQQKVFPVARTFVKATACPKQRTKAYANGVVNYLT